MFLFQKATLSFYCQESNPKTLVLKGSLTGRNAEMLKRHCPQGGPLRLDLSGIQAIDGLGLAALVSLGTRPQVTLCSLPRCVRLPLEKTRLFMVLDIEG